MSRPTYAGSTSKTPTCQNERGLIGENEKNTEETSYECGVCDFVSFNRNELQVWCSLCK